jgi:hypothetical protein
MDSDWRGHPVQATPLDNSRLERLARLGDELHATANRVARFVVDEHPVVDPVRVMKASIAGAALAPEWVLFRLDFTAERLRAALEPLSAVDWARIGQMDNRLVTLGEVVDGVLHGAVHDVLDLIRPASDRPDRERHEQGQRDQAVLYREPGGGRHMNDCVPRARAFEAEAFGSGIGPTPARGTGPRAGPPAVEPLAAETREPSAA